MIKKSETNHTLFASETAIPDWWQAEVRDVEQYIQTKVTKGAVQKLADSSGGREVYEVVYGLREAELSGTANFNSALGSGSADAYMRKEERKYPVLMVLAGIHGHEVEGMIAAKILLELMETGSDLLGRKHDGLSEKLQQLRIIVYPLLNPDGRVRVPYRGWAGLPGHEMTRYGQGTRRDGSSYTWRPSKAVHPMQGDVGILGGYFDDQGINLMHDEWFAPMSPVTAALLKRVAAEGPDLLLNLHSYEIDAGMLETNYIPKTLKQELLRYTEQYVYPGIRRYGIRTGTLPSVYEDGEEGMMHPPLNLTSMCYHAGATLACTFESPHGISENFHTYEQLHDLHLALIESAADYLLDKQVKQS